MNAMLYLLPVAVLLGLAALAAFLWSLETGQYEDLDGDAARILHDRSSDEDATGGRTR